MKNLLTPRKIPIFKMADGKALPAPATPNDAAANRVKRSFKVIAKANNVKKTTPPKKTKMPATAKKVQTLKKVATSAKNPKTAKASKLQLAKKAKTAAAPKATKTMKAAAQHPKYSEMVASAITALKETKTPCRQAIVKYIMDNYNVGTNDSSIDKYIDIAVQRRILNAQQTLNCGFRDPALQD